MTGEAANTYDEGARKFVDSLNELITDEGYLAGQIFNVYETGLYWKRMPERAYIKRSESMPAWI